MKLNFITDQGSILASTSWARRVDGACLGAPGRPGAVGRALGAAPGAMARAAVAVWAADGPGGGGGGGAGWPAEPVCGTSAWSGPRTAL